MSEQNKQLQIDYLAMIKDMSKGSKHKVKEEEKRQSRKNVFMEMEEEWAEKK